MLITWIQFLKIEFRAWNQLFVDICEFEFWNAHVSFLQTVANMPSMRKQQLEEETKMAAIQNKIKISKLKKKFN